MKLFTCCHPFFWLWEDSILWDKEGGKARKIISIVCHLRVPPPSQKATHGWWERAVKNNKSAKDYSVFVYHTTSATQGRVEESVTSLRSGWGGSRSLACWEPGRERWRRWSCRNLRKGCIRVPVPWLSETRGKDGVFPSSASLWLESEAKSKTVVYSSA